MSESEEIEETEVDNLKENKVPKSKSKNKRKRKRKSSNESGEESDEIEEPPKKKQKKKKRKRSKFKTVKCEDCDGDVKISKYDEVNLYDAGMEIYCNKCMKEQGCEGSHDSDNEEGKRYSRCGRCGATICSVCKKNDGGYCWECADKWRRRGERVGAAIDPLIHWPSSGIIGPIKQSEYNKKMTEKGFHGYDWTFSE